MIFLAKARVRDIFKYRVIIYSQGSGELYQGRFVRLIFDILSSKSLSPLKTAKFYFTIGSAGTCCHPRLGRLILVPVGVLADLEWTV